MESEISGLATIVTVDRIDAIAQADKIERIGFQENDWHVVAKKDEFQKGTLAVFLSIGCTPDPECKATEFLKGQPIKTRKIKGVISQGVLVPLSCLAQYDPSFVVQAKAGQDVTKWMRVRKWIPPTEEYLYDEKQHSRTNTFPAWVPKTEEQRIQNCKSSLQEILDHQLEVVITQKDDGTFPVVSVFEIVAYESHFSW